MRLAASHKAQLVCGRKPRGGRRELDALEVGQVTGGQGPVIGEAPECIDQVGLKHADNLQRPAVGHCRNAEPLSLEGDLYVLALGEIEALQAKELLPVFLALEPRDELGHDLIGTGVVDDPHPREV